MRAVKAREPGYEQRSSPSAGPRSEVGRTWRSASMLLSNCDCISRFFCSSSLSRWIHGAALSSRASASASRSVSASGLFSLCTALQRSKHGGGGRVGGGRDRCHQRGVVQTGERGSQQRQPTNRRAYKTAANQAGRWCCSEGGARSYPELRTAGPARERPASSGTRRASALSYRRTRRYPCGPSHAWSCARPSRSAVTAMCRLAKCSSGSSSRERRFSRASRSRSSHLNQSESLALQLHFHVYGRELLLELLALLFVFLRDDADIKNLGSKRTTHAQQQQPYYKTRPSRCAVSNSGNRYRHL